MPATDITLTANFQSTLPQEPPTLTPGTIANFAGANFNIEFTTYDGDYSSAIYAVEIGGTEYTNIEGQNDVFYAQGDRLELRTWNIPALQDRGTHTIRVKATGYQDAEVEQVITAGWINGDKCVTLDGPESGETYNSGQSLPEIKLQLMDAYGNALIDGPDAVIELTAVIPGGYGSGSTLSGTLTAAADALGQVTFDDIVVNLPDEVSQVINMAIGFTGQSGGSGFTFYLKGSNGEFITFTVAEQP